MFSKDSGILGLQVVDKSVVPGSPRMRNVPVLRVMESKNGQKEWYCTEVTAASRKRIFS